MATPLNHALWLGMLLLGCHILIGGCTSTTGQEVVVYVSVDRKDAEPILKQFEASTGIRVRAVYDSEAAKTTGLVTRILAEQEQPRCDVFWNNEHVQTMLLSQRGLCAVSDSRDSADVDAAFKSPDGLWTSVATRARVIVYNTACLDYEDAPKTLQELANPLWDGRCAIADPQFGTTRTHIAFLSARYGQKWMERFLGSLLANNVRIVNGNAAVKNLVASAKPGTSSICVGLTDTDDVYAGIAAGDPIQMIIPNEGDDGTLVIPSTVCILKNAPHPVEAKRLFAYLVSEKTQKQLTSSNPGYQPLGHGSGDHRTSVYQAGTEILEHLIPSSRWTRDNFRP